MLSATKKFPAFSRSLLRLTVLAFAVLLVGCCVCFENETSLQIATQADHLLAQGKREDAEAECRRALDACPGSRTGNRLMGRLFIEDGRADEALECFQKAAHVPADTSRLTEPESIAIAESLLVLCRADTAAKFLEDTNAVLAPRSHLARLYAVALFKAKDFVAAFAAFERYRAGEPITPDDRGVAWEIYSRFLASATRGEIDETLLKHAAFVADAFPESALIQAFYGRILSNAGHEEKALAAARKALAIEPYHAEVVAAARGVFVRAGLYAQALAAWRRSVPRAVVYSSGNKILSHFSALPAMSAAAQRPNATAEALLTLICAYRAIGWVDEAAAVCRRALGHYPTEASLTAEADKISRHAVFIARLRDYFSEQYRLRLRGEACDDIDDILAAMRSLAVDVGVNLPEGDDEPYRVLFYGREIHAANFAHSALARYFLEFGRYLHISQIYGEPLCKIMNVVAWFAMRRSTAASLLPTEYGFLERVVRINHELVVCDEDVVLSFGGFLADAPRVAGHASLTRAVCYVDLCALRPTRRSIQKIVEVVRDGDDSGCAALYRRALAITALSSDDAVACDEIFQRLTAAEIDAVATHEEGHLVDMDNHLPLWAHLPAHLFDGLRAGLSPRRIVNRIEFYAEAFAAANSAVPHIVVLRNLNLLDAVRVRSYESYLIYYLSLERDQISPYTNAAEEISTFLQTKIGYDTGRAEEALAGLKPARLRELCAEFCERRGVGR